MRRGVTFALVRAAVQEIFTAPLFARNRYRIG
jgi:hypothetical protein